MASVSAGREWRVQSYTEQEETVWPKEGRFILAQYDQDSIVVYQAYCPEIADFAVKNQRFGGAKFSYGRMSWIKTNFLWMMYRSGWACKPGQERVLAVRITREGFDSILAKALTGADERTQGMAVKSDVRLQWDPDHSPSGEPAQRRAIQLGMRNEVLRKYGNEWIVEIKDVTDFVREQYELHVKPNQLDQLMVAEERVYPVTDPAIAAQIRVDTA